MAALQKKGMTQPSLAVLGPLTLQASAGSAPLRLGRKSQALLACLAGHGAAGVSRSKLIALLWADQPEEDARAALRQCLHQLRRALPQAGEWIGSGGEDLALDPSCCEVDLWRFEALAASANPAALAAAARLWRGDFAQGLELPGDDGVWVAARRERCRDQAHGVLQAAAALPHLGERFDAALALARHLLADDPLHEGGYRALMRLYAKAGLRAKALQAFEQCRAQLQQQLGVAPSPMTLQVAQELSQQAPARPSSETTSPAFDHMLAGWHYFSHFTPQANARARTEYEAAVRLAPGDAEPVAMLGWTHWMDATSGWTADAARSDEAAAACSERASGYAPQHPAALSLRSKVRLWRHQHAEAIDDARQALALVPDMPYLHFHLADALVWAGQPQEGLEHIGRALAANPNDHGVFLAVEGFARFLMHDLDGARTALERARIRNPSYCWIYSTLGSVLHEQGEYALAREMAARARQLNRRLSVDFSRRTLPLRRPQDRARIVAACEANGYPAFVPTVNAVGTAVA